MLETLDTAPVARDAVSVSHGLLVISTELSALGETMASALRAYANAGGSLRGDVAITLLVSDGDVAGASLLAHVNLGEILNR